MNLGGKYLNENELKLAGFKKIGKNVKIHTRSSIYGVENIEIGDNSRIDDFSVIICTNGFLKIGRYVHISNHCMISAKAGLIINDFAGLSPGVNIFTSSGDYQGNNLTNPTVPQEFVGDYSGKVEIGKHAVIGAKSIILPNVKIGDGASIGSLSLIKNNLEEWTVYAGVPATRIKSRSKRLLKFEEKLKNHKG